MLSERAPRRGLPSSSNFHTPLPTPNANKGFAKNAYQQEQYATNTSDDTDFMNYGMWRSGVASRSTFHPTFSNQSSIASPLPIIQRRKKNE
jgi:hypothetical protein